MVHNDDLVIRMVWTLITYRYGETLTSQDDKAQGRVGLNMDQADI